ncbi:MAG: rhodanese-like domain-containing protein [Halofilum sp. (in: g-proteobacteria)]
MDRIPEFATNHPILIAAVMLTIGVIVGVEIQRYLRVAETVSISRATRLSHNEDAVFVDTRRRKEYESGHLPGARNVPAAEVEQYVKQLQKIRERPLVLYDDAGMEAQRAAKKLAGHGFSRLYELEGGLPAWRKANLPVEQGSESKQRKKSR